MSRFCRLLCGLLALAGLALTPSSARAHGGFSATPTLFGSNEIRSPALTSFSNWTGMLARFRQNETLGPGLCASAGAGPRGCAWDNWQTLIVRLRPLPPMEQLQEVNRAMNKRRYILDRNNWGMEDYWATVFEFLRKNGDCEDFAIAKYATLRALGWPADTLRLVIVRDTKLDLNHAVLAVYMPDGIYIGDNQVSGLVRADRIRHYKPIYSINESAWWLHRPPPR